MATVLKYLAELCTNPAALEQFRKDPDLALSAAGVTGQQAAAIKSRDADQIQAVVVAELPKDGQREARATTTIVVVI